MYFSLNLLINFSSCRASAHVPVPCRRLESSWPPHVPSCLLFVSLILGKTSCCQEEVVCERLPACLPANAPHWHVSVRVNHRCLFLSRAGLLQTSHGSPSVSLPRAGAAQVTQGDMTSMPPIHQTARSGGRKQSELNLGSYYSLQADCFKVMQESGGF